MSTAISPARPPTSTAAAAGARIGPGRIVERTTTITREIFLDGPTHLQTPAGSEPDSRSESEISVGSIHGIDRALVRLGVWLIGLGRRHALHPAALPVAGTRARADDIARRVDAAKAHDMKHFIGLPY